MGGGEVLKKGVLIKSPPLDTGALKVNNILCVACMHERTCLALLYTELGLLGHTRWW